MTTYFTHNPLGSSDPRDLYDNAENLDVLTNSREALSNPDRFGVQRKTWYGMEQDFQDFLLASGYQDLGDYAASIEVVARNQVIRADGELWRLSASTDLPYTTTGAGMPEGGAFVSVGDAVLRQELAAQSGAGLIGGVAAIFDSVADLQAATWLEVGDRVRKLGYYYPGDGGAADHIVSASASSFGSPQLSNGLTASLVLDGVFNSEKYGVVEGSSSDQTDKLNECIADAISSNVQEITLNQNIVCTKRVIGAHNVRIVGKGSIDRSKKDNYNIVVNRPTKNQLATINSGKVSARFDTYSNAFRAGVINVVLVGDSISSPDPDTITGFDDVTTYLESRLKSALTGKTVNFYNRAIGGATMESFNAPSLPAYLHPIASVKAPWYTDFNRAWFDYVADLDPDLVILGFGMNGENTTGLGFTSLNEVWFKFVGLAKTPSIAYITTPTPTNNSGSGTFSGFEPQSRRNHFAEMTRSYAGRKGEYVVDVNRLQQIACFGIDPVSYYKKETFNFNIDQVAESSSTVICTTTSRYFTAFVDVEVESTPLIVQSNFNPRNTAEYNNSIHITNSYVRVYTNTRLIQEEAITATSGTYHSFKIHFDRNRIRITMDGDVVMDLFNSSIENFFDSDILFSSGPNKKNIRVFEYHGGGSSKNLTDDQAWGEFTGDGSVGVKPLIGGNGVNHPSTIGVSSFYKPAIDEFISDLPDAGLREIIYDTPVSSGIQNLITGKRFSAYSYCIYVFSNEVGVSRSTTHIVPRELLVSGYAIQQVERGGSTTTGGLINVTINSDTAFTISKSGGGTTDNKLALIIGVF